MKNSGKWAKGWSAISWAIWNPNKLRNILHYSNAETIEIENIFLLGGESIAVIKMKFWGCS